MEPPRSALLLTRPAVAAIAPSSLDRTLHESDVNRARGKRRARHDRKTVSTMGPDSGTGGVGAVCRLLLLLGETLRHLDSAADLLRCSCLWLCLSAAGRLPAGASGATGLGADERRLSTVPLTRAIASRCDSCCRAPEEPLRAGHGNGGPPSCSRGFATQFGFRSKTSVESSFCAVTVHLVCATQIIMLDEVAISTSAPRGGERFAQYLAQQLRWKASMRIDSRPRILHEVLDVGTIIFRVRSLRQRPGF